MTIDSWQPTLARSAGPLHHQEGAKGRNVRQRGKPEEGSPVRGAFSQVGNAGSARRICEEEIWP